jgi:hypothetical protein
MRPLPLLRLAAATAILAFGSYRAAAACLDLSSAARLELNGELTYRVFPGPPNYADVKAGDAPEPAFILALPSPICIGGDKETSTVELLPTAKTAEFMRALINSQVLVSLAKPVATSEPHAHAPLAAAARGIAKLEGATPDYAGSQPGHDAAADIVRKFYESLGQGDGEQAATFVAPEVRRGPLSGAKMTQFYSRLPDPLRLTELRQINANEFFVAYAFRASGKACRGRAVVDTVNRSGEITSRTFEGWTDVDRLETRQCRRQSSHRNSTSSASTSAARSR